MGEVTDITSALLLLASWAGHLPTVDAEAGKIRQLLLELRAAREELTELRQLRRPLTLFGVWAEGSSDPIPDRICATDDGDDVELMLDDVELMLDALPLIEQVLDRQAKAWVRQHADGKGPELGALLALVPSTYALRVDEGDQRPYEAGWESWDERVCATGATREAAVLAATRELLDLDEGSLRRRVAGSPAAVVRAAMALVDAWADDGDGYHEENQLRRAVEQLRGATAEPRPGTCRSCRHWQRDAKPAASGDGTARPCGIGGELRHPAGGRDCDRFEAADQSDTEPAPSSGEQPCAVICLGLELARCDKEKP
jgi:hypothetical protein